MAVVEALNEFLFEGDPQDKYLIKYSAIPLGTIAFYIVFVKWWGPYIMRDKKPFELKYIMIVYNFAQCFANAYVVYKLIDFDVKFWYGHCLGKYHPDMPIAFQYGRKVFWKMFLIKYIDLFDTVFFVLRKKDSHITFLHVFHHSMVCFCGWWFFRSVSVMGMGYFIPLGMTMNFCVHVVMYFYYGLAAFGPSMRKYLWWKRHLTQLQILQFFVAMLYMLYGFISGCEEMGTIEVTSFLLTLAICVMFLDFYRKDRQNRKLRKKQATTTATNGLQSKNQQRTNGTANGDLHKKEK